MDLNMHVLAFLSYTVIISTTCTCENDTVAALNLVMAYSFS